MLFLISLAIGIPILIILIGIIIVSFLLAGALGYFPYKFCIKKLIRKGFHPNGGHALALKSFCIAIGLVASVFVVGISMPLYSATANTWCMIEGSLDATGQSLNQCEARFNWLESS